MIVYKMVTTYMYSYGQIHNFVISIIGPIYLSVVSW